MKGRVGLTGHAAHPHAAIHLKFNCQCLSDIPYELPFLSSSTLLTLIDGVRNGE